jgi:hypothetical protein
MTEGLQPLDRSVFVALKAHAPRLFRLRVRHNPMLHCPKLDAAQEMVSAWELVSATTLTAGWEIYEGESWEDDPELLNRIEHNIFTAICRALTPARRISLFKGIGPMLVSAPVPFALTAAAKTQLRVRELDSVRRIQVIAGASGCRAGDRSHRFITQLSASACERINC